MVKILTVQVCLTVPGVCPLNILLWQQCKFTSLLILPLKLNPHLSPVWLTPQHYRQAMETRTNTHVHTHMWLRLEAGHPRRLCVFEGLGLRVWSFRFACVSVCLSHLVGLSAVVYCTAALPTDGHYHTVADSTQGRDFSHFQNLSHIITLWYLCSL